MNASFLYFCGFRAINQEKSQYSFDQLMNSLRRTFFLSSICLLGGLGVFAQEGGSLMVDGIVTSAGKPVDGAEVKIFKDKGKLLYRTTNSAGKFRAKLELGAEYVISAGLPGSTTKTFNFITEVPEKRKNEEFTKQVEIDLNPLTADAKGRKKWEQSAGGILYKESEGGFITVNYDLDEWKKQMADAADRERLRKQAEEEARVAGEKRRQEAEELARQEQAKRDAEQQVLLAAQAKEQSRLDSIAAVQLILAREMEKRKLAADQKKTEEDKLKDLAKAEQDRKRTEAERLAHQQFVTDSIANSKTEAIKLAAEEKARKEAEALAMKKAGKERQKAVADSIANARDEQARMAALAKAKQKAIADSITTEEKIRVANESLAAKNAGKTRQQQIADSIASAKTQQAQLAAQQKYRQQQIADSLAKVKTLEAQLAAQQKYRQQQIADSIASVEKIKKQEEEQLKLKAELEKKNREKAIAYSLAVVKAEQQRKDAEEQARLKAEEAARVEAERKLREAEEQARTKAEWEKKAKEESDRIAKIEAERKAQAEAEQKAKEEREQALAEKIERDKQEAAKIADEQKAKEEEIVRKKQEAAKALYELRKNNSIKEETIRETGKTTLVTTVKIDGVQTIFKKLTHDWGGIFYYKNGADISDVLYLQELKTAQEQLNP